MRRLLTLGLGAACALILTAPAPAPAALTKCPQGGNVYELNEVDGVSCARAKKVVKKWFKDNESTPFGFTCKQKQYEGGVTTICRKGDKKIKHSSAD